MEAGRHVQFEVYTLNIILDVVALSWKPLKKGARLTRLELARISQPTGVSEQLSDSVP